MSSRASQYESHLKNSLPNQPKWEWCNRRYTWYFSLDMSPRAPPLQLLLENIFFYVINLEGLILKRGSTKPKGEG